MPAARSRRACDDSHSPAHFARVAGTRFGCVEWFDEIGSTNTELLERARRGAPEGTVLIADAQTAGRGRRGRRWTAPAGSSLMMSVLLRPPPDRIPAASASLVTLALGLAAIDACEQCSGVRPGLKWPNDLVVAGPIAGPGDRPADRPEAERDLKLAGILAESVIDGPGSASPGSASAGLEALVVGMGLNTGWPEVPAALQGIATSLNLAAGAPVDRVQLASRVLEGLEARYATLCGDISLHEHARSGAQALLDEARANSATLGRRVKASFDVTADMETLAGVATGLDDCGRLLITDDEGVIHTVAVGDVVHLLPGH